MKIGIFGDIHSNLPALEVVLDYLGKRCDRLFCTGDIVGYGPHPNQCINKMMEHNIKAVSGNHDEYVILGAPTAINHYAREIITWTQKNIGLEQFRWLANRPMKIDVRGGKGVSIIHASHIESKRWVYIQDELSCRLNFSYQKNKISFYGHTHYPILFYKDAVKVKTLLQFPKVLPTAEKYMINVGSVGQPRDRDNRASCVIFDTKTNEISLKRLEYDIDRVVTDMERHGFPKFLIDRLAYGI